MLAALVGFALATLLADMRTTTLQESDEGVLSFEVSHDGYIRPSIAASADGRPALITSVSLLNTGPRPVALERVELMGTSYRSDDLRGRRLDPGADSVVALLRPVDCANLELTRAPGALRVHATTGAGTSSTDLRISTDLLQGHDEQIRSACGLSPAESALFVQDGRDSLEGTTLVIDLVLRNATAEARSVARLVPTEGLRIVGVTSRDRSPVDLPLRLEPGDFDPPVDPYVGAGPETELSVRLEVDDCALFWPLDRDVDVAAVQVWVTDGRQEHPLGFGTEMSFLQRLGELVCT